MTGHGRRTIGPDGEPCYTTQGALAALGVSSAQTLNRWAANGKVTRYNLGTTKKARWAYDAAVVDLLDGGRASDNSRIRDLEEQLAYKQSQLWTAHDAIRSLNHIIRTQSDVIDGMTTPDVPPEGASRTTAADL